MSRKTILWAFQTAFPFWDELSPPDQTDLLINTSHIFLPKGINIYQGNNSTLGIFYIVSGGMRIYVLSDTGRDITLYRLGQGQLGYLLMDGLLGSVLFNVNVETEVDTELYMIRPDAFKRISKSYLSVQLFSSQLTSSRFSDIMWTFQQLLLFSFDKRLAIFLVDELTKTGGDTVCYTHEQIAKYVGSAREVVSRMLKLFASDGLVEISRRGVRVLDKRRLRSLAIASGEERGAHAQKAAN